MLRVGLSGGIGSGKSTVAARLVERGALLIDSDALAREVVEPGTPGLEQIRERFGDAVIEDGALDRPALAEVVFADESARADLNAIVHPLVLAETLRQLDEVPPDAVVVHDIPLLVELARGGDYHLVVIVDAPAATRIDRLVRSRGMGEGEAQARVDAQADDDQRRAAADVLLSNVGTPQELAEQVDRLWEERLQPFNDNLMADARVPRPATATLVDPDPEWARVAERLTARIGTQLGRGAVADQLVGVDHIGSTAVPGMPAKDVIDLQVRVHDVDEALSADFRGAMRAAGFVHGRPAEDTAHDDGEAGAWRKALYGGADPALVVHVHVRQADGPGAELALAFRDWLRADRSHRKTYLTAKRAAAAASAGAADRTAYPHAKEPWFAQQLPAVRDWVRRTGWSAPGV